MSAPFLYVLACAILYYMDILSHALWGGVGFGRKNRSDFWAAFMLGMSPDLLAFGIPSITRIITALSGNGLPEEFHGNMAYFPSYVFTLYSIGHSLVIFTLAFIAVWIFRKKPYIPLFAWFFHIFLDIFTHSIDFFPTPFLWPLSDYHFDGQSWGQPLIFIPNVLLLFAAYGYWAWMRRKDKMLQFKDS